MKKLFNNIIVQHILIVFSAILYWYITLFGSQDSIYIAGDSRTSGVAKIIDTFFGTKELISTGKPIDGSIASDPLILESIWWLLLWYIMIFLTMFYIVKVTQKFFNIDWFKDRKLNLKTSFLIIITLFIFLLLMI